MYFAQNHKAKFDVFFTVEKSMSDADCPFKRAIGIWVNCDEITKTWTGIHAAEVSSSGLGRLLSPPQDAEQEEEHVDEIQIERQRAQDRQVALFLLPEGELLGEPAELSTKIGRASCRERV